MRCSGFCYGIRGSPSVSSDELATKNDVGASSLSHWPEIKPVTRVPPSQMECLPPLSGQFLAPTPSPVVVGPCVAAEQNNDEQCAVQIGAVGGCEKAKYLSFFARRAQGESHSEC